MKLELMKVTLPLAAVLGYMDALIDVDESGLETRKGAVADIARSAKEKINQTLRLAEELDDV